MKKLYTAARKQAYLELEPSGFGDRWWISGLWVPFPHRKNGLAKKLLAQVCKDADTETVHLGLAVMPADNGVTFKGLCKLYEEFGFTREGGESTVMHRPPQPPKESLLFIDDKYLTCILRPRPGTCPVCEQPKQRVIDVASIRLPDGVGVPATVMYNRRDELPHTAIGLTCGCYAKFHRQVAHIADSRMHYGHAL